MLIVLLEVLHIIYSESFMRNLINLENYYYIFINSYCIPASRKKRNSLVDLQLSKKDLGRPLDSKNSPVVNSLIVTRERAGSRNIQKMFSFQQISLQQNLIII